MGLNLSLTDLGWEGSRDANLTCSDVELLFAVSFYRCAIYLAWLHSEQADRQNFLYYSRDLQVGLCFNSEQEAKKRKGWSIYVPATQQGLQALRPDAMLSGRAACAVL